MLPIQRSSVLSPGKIDGVHFRFRSAVWLPLLWRCLWLLDRLRGQTRPC